MMCAPKDPSKYIQMICVESYELNDKVWGNCSLIKGKSYDVLEDTDGYVLVRFGNGLCPSKLNILKLYLILETKK